jgi:hypothetical protein
LTRALDAADHHPRCRTRLLLDLGRVLDVRGQADAVANALFRARRLAHAAGRNDLMLEAHVTLAEQLYTSRQWERAAAQQEPAGKEAAHAGGPGE